MGLLHSAAIQVGDAAKSISVYCDDVTRFSKKIDILTTSAFVGSYSPTPRTVFRALYDIGISVSDLANAPQLDLRNPCHILLSQQIALPYSNIGRIGCIEFRGGHLFSLDPYEAEQSMINSIRAYFHMLDIASVYGTDVTTIALPLLGSGNQSIQGEFLLIPLINECISFLKRNPAAENICFVEKNPEKAQLIANCLQKSLRFSEPPAPVLQPEMQRDLAFISYSSKDKNIADNLCAKLEQKGIKVWYAPRDVHGPYAAAIANAIDRAKYFVVILSQNSIASEHVLNEIDLAFQNISSGMRFKPLRIDDALFTPSFKYYLSRQHWMDATIPPLEERLNEFTQEIMDERNV
jgi:hypothetical protein